MEDKSQKVLLFLLTLLLIAVVLYVSLNNSAVESIVSNGIVSEAENQDMTGDFEQEFLNRGLLTNTAVKSIELNEILGGGPGKDGIPAITNPTFISVSEADEIEDDDKFGISVTIGETSRFYPYSILVWHEIVNDVIEDTPVLVTFCPLCGSAIVFDPVIDGKTRQFGVSGLLWESNLLMYDSVNESLWSQSIGEAVVGNDTGTKLNVLPSQLITFEEFKTNHPDGDVLSRATGYARSYNFYPYGDYETSERLVFPVSVQDTRLFGKEIMYIVSVDDKSVAFKREDLINSGAASVEVNGETINASVSGQEITVTDPEGNIIPGYHEMWFSWATHHQDKGVVWTN